MRISLTEEQIFLQKSLRELFTKECPPELVRALRAPDADPRNATQLWQSLVGSGFFGLALPASAGGEDGDLFDLALAHEEAGRALCPTTVLASVAFGVALHRLAPADRTEPRLRRLAAGELVATVAIGDPEDPSDPRPPLTAERSGTGWTVSGRLPFLPNGDIADAVLVTAATAAGVDGPSRVLGFVLTPGGPGWLQRRLRTFGHDVQTVADLDTVAVPDPADVIGDTAAGLSATDLAGARNALTALQCAEMVGGAAAVLDRTVDYVKVRHQFGRPIAGFQAVQHHVADLRIALDGARLTAYQAAWWAGRGHVAERETAIAKLRCNRAYKAATLTAHQLHGGMGYLRETDLHMWSERAKVTELRDGGDAVQLARIARSAGFGS